MDFLAPLMLVGALGALVPVAIHLFGRRRARVLRFGAMDFLLGTKEKVARRLRVREWILLALRAAVCLALPLALAKPMVSCAARGPMVERGPQAVVLVVDNSFAMSHRAAGEETLLARAKARARATLDALGHEAEVAIVYAAEGSGVPAELSRDHLKLAAELGGVRATTRPADLTAALRKAQALLAGSPHRARRVYVFSALPATGFPPGEPPWPEGQGPELHYVDVSGAGAPLANAAVTAVRAEKEPDLGERGVRVVAEVANYGPEKLADLGVTLRVGGRAVARGRLALGPGESGAKSFSVPLPGDARAAEAVVEIDADGLTGDDRRYVRLEVRSEVRVLVVDGDPRTVRHDDESWYLEIALRPGDRADSAIAVTTVTPDELAGVRLADHDVVFLCNVPALGVDVTRALVEWAEAGGGVFVSLGDKVDAGAYNAQMAALLPQELRSVKNAAPVGATARERDDLAERLAAKVETGHPVLSVFGGAGLAGLRAARFHKIFLLGPSTRDDRKVLARFASGAPALVEARLGKGRVLLFTSTLDRDWTDLPIHQAYLPLVQQAVRYLAREPVRAPAHESLVGHVREVPVNPDDGRVEIVGPSGGKTVFDAARVKGRQSLAFAATSEPGFYRVSVAGAGGTLRPRPAADFVVNVDPRGSDIRKADETLMPRSGPSASAEGAAPGGKRQRKVELWHGLAAALLVILLIEGVLARGRGGR